LKKTAEKTRTNNGPGARRAPAGLAEGASGGAGCRRGSGPVRGWEAGAEAAWGGPGRAAGGGQKPLLPGCVTRAARGAVRARTGGEGAGLVYFPTERFIDKPKSMAWGRGV